MAKKQRLHRPDPERTMPNRRFSTMFRRDADIDSNAGAAPEAASDEVGDAVRMGYSVIEEQIRQGQRAAEQITGAPFGLGTAATSGKDIANRLMRFTTDLAALHFDLMGVLMQPSGLGGLAGNGAPAQSSGSRVSIEIESKRKNKVTLDLWAGKHTAALTVPALHSAESDKTPLTDVSFTPGTELAPANLRIVIPDSQPPGVYSGLILDAETSQASGTLSLTLD